jgi:hypothetical protein
MFFKKKQCSKCQNKIGVFEKYGSAILPLCFDCKQMSIAESQHAKNSTISEPNMDNGYYKKREFFKKAIKNPDLALSLIESNEFCKVFEHELPNGFYSEYSSSKWSGPFKLVIPSMHYRHYYFFIKKAMCISEWAKLSNKLYNANQTVTIDRKDLDEIIKSVSFTAVIEEIEKNNWVVEEEGFIHPKWSDIANWVDENAKDLDLHAIWHKISLWWIEKLYAKLGDNFYVNQSSHFLIFSSQSQDYTEALSSFLEKTRSSILRVYQDIAADVGYGKHVVLIFNNEDQYYKYISHFYKQEGTYGKSSGVYLNEGYGHFVFPYQERRFAEAIVAHELTHTCVSHISLPAWINEAFAVSLEKYITGTNNIYSDVVTRQDLAKLWKDQRDFWRKITIQEFWSGNSFHRSDDGQEFSYLLADALFNNICDRYKSFKELALFSTTLDAGNEIAKVLYDEDLGTQTATILGDGNWEPSMYEIDSIFKKNHLA